VLALWILVFSLVVGWQVDSNRASIHELKHAKASVRQLQKTNCGLKRFLFKAADTRYASARVFKREHNRLAYQTNLQAAKGYVVLAKRFSAVGVCPIHRTNGH
jgi:hypothetical protein